MARGLEKEVAALMQWLERPDDAKRLLDKVRDQQLGEFLVGLLGGLRLRLTEKGREKGIGRAVTNEFKFWFRNDSDQKCFAFVRPSASEVKIFFAAYGREEISRRLAEAGFNAKDWVSEDTSNTADHFYYKVTVAAGRLAKQAGQIQLILQVLLGLCDNLRGDPRLSKRLSKARA